MTAAPIVLLEALLVAGSLGATIWFFFVQTPALLRGMGMKKFLPLQIRLVRIFAPALAAGTTAVLLASLFRHGGPSAALWPAALAAASAWINAAYVVPRAVRQGGAAIRDVHKGEGGDGSLTSFTLDGGGEPTKLFHRLVVLFVLLMVGGLLAEGSGLLVQPDHAVSTATHEAHGAHTPAAAATGATNPDQPFTPDGRWRADPATSRNVAAMHVLVKTARAESAADGQLAPADLAAIKTSFEKVFQDCTMEGPAHVALHDFLVPLVGGLESLESGEGVAEALMSMDKQLASFGKSFN